jgi:hypothetical protein
VIVATVFAANVPTVVQPPTGTVTLLVPSRVAGLTPKVKLPLTPSIPTLQIRSVPVGVGGGVGPFVKVASVTAPLVICAQTRFAAGDAHVRSSDVGATPVLTTVTPACVASVIVTTVFAG